ncbi:NACHT domain-containing protein [Catellatospora aurea]|uniref:NACHT domain-containing protein n=1 Tax=Catellatospora aurea TaxID=1337874 RepID=A0ABW2H5R1_9ACTN
MSLNPRLLRIVGAALAVAPLAAVAAFFRDFAVRHPVALLVGLISWELLLLIGGLFAKVFGKLEERWVDRLAGWIDAALHRMVSRYPRQYRYFLSRMHHDVDLRGLSTWGVHALAMEEVFVDLSLRPQAVHRVPAGPMDEHEFERAALDEEMETSADNVRRSIWETLDRYPDVPLAILGPPGSGKTTLLRHVTLALCGTRRRRRLPRAWRHKVPMLLFLREHVAVILSEPQIDLADVVRRTLTRLTKTEPSGWLERQLDMGRCVVMFDGLDEVASPEDRIVVMRWVRQQIDQYPRNRYLLTSRPFGFENFPLASATVVQVRQFTDVQVETFVRGWYLAVEKRSANRDDVGVRARADEGSGKLLARVYASPALLGLATNPLLLTMIASVHKYRSALPGSRAELYREILQVFLGKRQEAKELPSDLSIDQKMVVLRTLAFVMMERRIRDISATTAATIIAPALEKVGYGRTPAEFLAEIEQVTGLLLERENGVYAFAHHTFQEYLTALHLAESETIGYLVDNLLDSWWREVILLRVANADATPIVRAALDADPPSIQMLSLAADCVDQAREVEAAAKRQIIEALSWRSWIGDSARRRLAAQVHLDRKLRRVVRARTGVFVCAEPVTVEEFGFFLADGGTPYIEPGNWAEQIAGDQTSPVSGVGPVAALQFADWVKALGVEARLPAPGDLAVDDWRRVLSPPMTRFWQLDSELRCSLSGLLNVGAEQLKRELVAKWLTDQIIKDSIVLSESISPIDAAGLGLFVGGRFFGSDEVFDQIFLTYLEAASEDLKKAAEGGSGHAKARKAAFRAWFDTVVNAVDPNANVPLHTEAHDLTPYAQGMPQLAIAVERVFAEMGSWPEAAGGLRISDLVQCFLAEAQGLDTTSTVVRAYLRTTHWAAISDVPSEARRTLADRIRRRNWQRKPVDWYLYDNLAMTYLAEWRTNGLLPRNEGIVLVRG